MTNLTSEEKKALDLMKKDSFRGISKDNVLQLISILDKVDPDVAKEIIHQIPDAVRGIIEVEKGYSELLNKGVESIDQSVASCYQSEDAIIQSLRQEIDKQGATFEEKKYYYEKMEDAAKRKEAKDTEHKNYIMNILDNGGKAIFLGLLFTAGLFLGRTSIALPGGSSR